VVWWLRQIAYRRLWRTPARAKLLADHFGGLPPVPGREWALAGTMAWIRASFEATGDGGSSAFWEPGPGWKASYPETTGYLVPTLYAYADHSREASWAALARRAAAWLVSVQAPEGGWQALQVDTRAPLRVFNTAMVLDGLAAATEREGDPQFREAGLRGLRWLLGCRDAEGRFSQHNFSEGGAFDALVIASMLEMARFAPSELREQTEAAARVALDQILAWQTPSGWFQHCNDVDRYRTQGSALLHHVGYTFDGLVRSGLLLGEPRYLDAARRGSLGLIASFDRLGLMSAQYLDGWEPHRDRAFGRFSWCLTGMSQVAIAWLRLAVHDREPKLLAAARRSSDLVSRVANREWGGPGLDHGVQGSYPLGSWYQAFQFVNWAAKYHADALLLERQAERALPAA
jgi:hypothetical protein